MFTFRLVYFYSKLSTLFELKLILRTTNSVLLDDIKAKVNVSFDTVKEISRSLGFEIGNYLFDFVDN